MTARCSNSALRARGRNASDSAILTLASFSPDTASEFAKETDMRWSRSAGRGANRTELVVVGDQKPSRRLYAFGRGFAAERLYVTAFVVDVSDIDAYQPQAYLLQLGLNV